MDLKNCIRKKNWWVHIGIVSILVIAVLLLLLKSLRPKVSVTGDELVVYCAAGIRLPVADAADAYTQEFGLPVRLEYGSSGDLEKRRHSHRHDHWLSDPGVSGRQIPLSTQWLIASTRGNSRGPRIPAAGAPPASH